MRRTNLRNTLVLAALLAALTCSAALGQGIFDKYKKKEAPTRSVNGLVTDEAEVALHAVVQLKNMRTLDVKSFHTDDAGKYYFYGLDPISTTNSAPTPMVTRRKFVKSAVLTTAWSCFTPSL